MLDLKCSQFSDDKIKISAKGRKYFVVGVTTEKNYKGGLDFDNWSTLIFDRSCNFIAPYLELRKSFTTPNFKINLKLIKKFINISN